MAAGEVLERLVSGASAEASVGLELPLSVVQVEQCHEGYSRRAAAQS